MLNAILSIVIFLGVLSFLMYFAEKYFPNLPGIVRALIIGAVLLALLRVAHGIFCAWICG